MLNKKLLFLVFLSFLFCPVSLFAQKKEKIKYPAEVYHPMTSAETLEKQLKTLMERFSEQPMPYQYEKYQKTPRNSYRAISGKNVKALLGELKNFVTMPDLEEITEYPRSWYVGIYNAAVPLYNLAVEIEKQTLLGNAKVYNAQVPAYYHKVKSLEDKLKDKPKKLSAAALKEITNVNIERRKKEYEVFYKKLKAQEAKEIEEQLKGKKSEDEKKQTSKTVQNTKNKQTQTKKTESADNGKKKQSQTKNKSKTKKSSKKNKSEAEK